MENGLHSSCNKSTIKRLMAEPAVVCYVVCFITNNKSCFVVRKTIFGWN